MTIMAVRNLSAILTGTLRRPRARIWLAAALMQAAALCFFAGDVVSDLQDGGLSPHLEIELFATLALAGGAGLGAAEVLRIAARERRARAALRRTVQRLEDARARIARHAAELDAATGAFARVVRTKFDHWSLTPAEAEVALLTLKGFDAAEIAALRGSARGTVRAQLSKVYEKSGLANRGRFVSSFIDHLVEREERSMA